MRAEQIARAIVQAARLRDFPPLDAFETKPGASHVRVLAAAGLMAAGLCSRKDGCQALRVSHPNQLAPSQLAIMKITGQMVEAVRLAVLGDGDLPDPPTPVTAPKAAPKPLVEAKAPKASRAPASGPTLIKPEPKPAPEPEPEIPVWDGEWPDMDALCPPEARRLVLVEAGALQCRWPLGEATEPGSAHTVFCCAPVTFKPDGSPHSYCRAHRARTVSRYAPRPLKSLYDPTVIPVGRARQRNAA